MTRSRPHGMTLAEVLTWYGVPTVEPSDHACIWPTGIARHSTGYYCVEFEGQKTYLHCLALRFRLGRKLDRIEESRHMCGQSGCANPWHIEPGTSLDNMADQYRHGTRVAGEHHPQARLSDAQVGEIRVLLSAGDLSESRIASRFGISRGTVYCPANGHTFGWDGENDKLRRRLAGEQTRNRALKDQLAASERSRAATQGALTKERKRSAGGACPCCNRTFVQLTRHMKSKHPEFVEAANP